jgi:methylmalonyl-CoA mutase, N-terminal domain
MRQADFDAWLKKNFPDGAEAQSVSGTPLGPVYTPLHVDAAQLAADAKPGVPPFTRGLHETMYRQRLWTVRQYSGFSSAAETNARWKKLLASGTTGLSTAFDLPTQLGLDPDDARAKGEVGRVGVPIANVEDMHRLFEGIDLAKVSVSMTINAPAAVLLAFLQVVAEERGIAPEKLRGTVQNDILKEYAARNNYIFPPAPSMDLTVDVIEHCAKVLRDFYPISVSGYHLREAGSTAQQEIAFTLANGIAYVAAAGKRGISAETVGRQLSFFFASGTEFLEEIAKFRAARRLWAKLMLERFGVKDEKSRQLRFHVQTCGSMLTSQQPENNLVRVGLQAMAAVLGGCQSLHTNSYDEAIGLPGELSARLGVATQQILAYETGAANVADPCGGSYAIEALTDKLEADSRKLIEEVDALGGAPQAVESGYYQRRIAEAAFRYQRDVESGTRKVVGVNANVETVSADNESSVQALRSGMEQEACAALAKVKTARNAASAKAALVALEQAARAGGNRMETILSAARARCSVGEICGVLREVYGEYRSKF